MFNKDIKDIFAPMILNLPEADIPFEGVTGWLFQGENHQIVFFDIKPIGKVAEHSHGAQWGMVIEGEMKLTIGNHTKVYKKGDYYNIPAGIVHSAFFKCQTQVMDFFEDQYRYKLKD